MGSDSELSDILNKLKKIEGLLESPGGTVIYHVNKLRADLMSAIKRQDYINYLQIESFLKLSQAIPNLILMPSMRGWAISPDVSLMLYQYILVNKPINIVEFGSGASTYIIAEALRKNGFGKLISIEHSTFFGEKVVKSLIEANLIDYVDVRIADLVDWSGDHLFDVIDDTVIPKWYNIDCISDCINVDFVFVDGPPGSINRFSRYPALFSLKDKLSSNFTIWVDDAFRDDERKICEEWAHDFSLDLKFVQCDKGLAILQSIK